MSWTDRLPEIADRRRVAIAIWLATAFLLSLLQLCIHGSGIGDPELWLDESSTWGVAHRSFGTVLTLPTEFHSQPPLYYLVLHFLMKISDARLFMRGFSWLCCLGLLEFVLFFVDELSLAARAFFCVVFLWSALPHYLSSALRPYGMAALGSFVATILFLRLVREPSRRRAIHYAIAALVMAYTMAFDVWVLAAHGTMFVVQLLVWMVRDGVRPTLARQRPALAAMAAIAVGYLPYLAMAIHWQYRSNGSANLRYALASGHHFYIAGEFFAFAPPVMTVLYALIALGVWGELRARNPMVLTWLLVALGQVSFVVYFMYGRNSLGPAGRYITPAFPSAIMLAALGFQQLSARQARPAWHLIPIALAWLAWPAWTGFREHGKTPVPLGEWGRLREAMKARPGGKAIFFDIGYSGQDFEYVVRNDRDIRTFTQRGDRLASGGNDHLNADYILATIAETRGTTACYYYQVANGEGVYASAFVPEMQRLGYQELRPIGGVHVFCQPDTAAAPP